MSNPQPLKRFGQNYLVDKNIIKKIISEFAPEKSDVVVEIGPGTGSLTAELNNRVKKLYAVEIDKRVVESLALSYPAVHVINHDFIKLDLNKFSNEKPLRIIGNIPYNITSPILFKLIENRPLVKNAMLMVQFEVAKRITAEEKSDDYGILGVLLNFFADTKICFKIPPTVFYPKPKVDSAIIHLDFSKQLPNDLDFKLFIQVVKAAFGNRRKKLKNSLGNSSFANITIDTNEFDTSRRAEELTIKEFVDLTRIIQRFKNTDR
ncbi:MAG: 16S rRNA (adenine(1518)-N(6)/adenine(1519)-N(6))-dimethyltransferase RsmA [Ignavibacteriales bacterium]|nr:16S rRNA (adenine(1518)-N(6)/adenine(1519)-N(6))-dimethyltransferase RsmA [Ignavibacteriales bacterium]